jgi:hypothetical protein
MIRQDGDVESHSENLLIAGKTSRNLSNILVQVTYLILGTRTASSNSRCLGYVAALLVWLMGSIAACCYCQMSDIKEQQLT